jgi:hypothetical protein
MVPMESARKKGGQKKKAKKIRLKAQVGTVHAANPTKQSRLEVETSREKDDGKKKRKRRLSDIASAQESPGASAEISKEDDLRKDKQELEHLRIASPVMEGKMIGNNMVLIDRKAGKVYSSTDRRRNGKRKKIGRLDDLGLVVLKNKRKKNCNAAPTAKQAGRFHVCLQFVRRAFFFTFHCMYRSRLGLFAMVQHRSKVMPEQSMKVPRHLE